MIGVNNVTLVGNIGTVSDIMTTTNGSRFVNISVATTELYYSANNEKKNNTQWHNVIFWNNMVELQKIISKGDLIYVEGRINYRKKNDNQIFTEIVAKNIRILNKKNYSVSEINTDIVDNTSSILNNSSLAASSITRLDHISSFSSTGILFISSSSVMLSIFDLPSRGRFIGNDSSASRNGHSIDSDVGQSVHVLFFAVFIYLPIVIPL